MGVPAHGMASSLPRACAQAGRRRRSGVVVRWPRRRPDVLPSPPRATALGGSSRLDALVLGAFVRRPTREVAESAAADEGLAAESDASWRRGLASPLAITLSRDGKRRHTWGPRMIVGTLDGCAASSPSLTYSREAYTCGSIQSGGAQQPYPPIGTLYAGLTSQEGTRRALDAMMPNRSASGHRRSRENDHASRHIRRQLNYLSKRLTGACGGRARHDRARREAAHVVGPIGCERSPDIIWHAAPQR